MKFEQIDSGTIKVVLSEQDMDDYLLDYDRMDYSDEATRKAILKILHRIQQRIPIDTDSSKLFIEAFPDNDGGCILYINIIDMDRPAKATAKTSARERTSFDTPLIFSFPDLNIVTSVCRRLLKEYAHMIIKSSLFFYEDHYQLLLYTYCRMEKKITGILEEYGDFLGKGAVLAAFYQEHGKEISRDNAIETIVYYLS